MWRLKFRVQQYKTLFCVRLWKINHSGPGCSFYEFYEWYIFQWNTRVYIINKNISWVSPKTFSFSPLSVLTTHEASIPWSQVSFLIIYLGAEVHIPYQAAYEIAHVYTKNAALALRPFHEFTGCDTVNTSCHLSPEIIGVVFAYMFFYTIKKKTVVL